MPPPIDDDPAALAADAARLQPFLHLVRKAYTLAEAAHATERSGRASSTDGALLRPRDFAADAHRAVYHAHRLGLDIERAIVADDLHPQPLGLSGNSKR